MRLHDSSKKKSLQALRHAYMWYYVVWVCLGLYTSYFKPEDGLTKPKAKRCKCKVSSLGQTPRHTNPREMPPSAELEQSFHRRRCLHPKPATKVEALDTESKTNVYICIYVSFDHTMPRQRKDAYTNPSSPQKKGTSLKLAVPAST